MRAVRCAKGSTRAHMHLVTVSLVTTHKIGAVIGTLVRMKRNTSTDELLQFSLAEKWKELKFLKYSKSAIDRVRKVMEGKFPGTNWG